MLLTTGIHWYWPARTHVTEIPIARQAENLRSQTLVTTDDKVVIVSGMIVHEVVDPVRFCLSSHDGFVTIKELALTAIHDVICSMSWEELKTEQRKGTLDTKLKNAAKRVIEEFGVKVVKVMLTDMAPGARVFKVVQATSQD
jgi:regulator of protease activity HflC (stomatin/prohibitin superfamily)